MSGTALLTLSTDPPMGKPSVPAESFQSPGISPCDNPGDKHTPELRGVTSGISPFGGFQSPPTGGYGLRLSETFNPPIITLVCMTRGIGKAPPFFQQGGALLYYFVCYLIIITQTCFELFVPSHRETLMKPHFLTGCQRFCLLTDVI